MPIRDLAAMNRSLDNDYGATRGAGAPVSHQLVLFSSDPLVEDDPLTVELSAVDCPGYARVPIANDATWATAVNGQKTTVEPVQLPATTDEWADSATHWGLRGADGSWWDCAALSEPLVVTGAGDGPLIQPVIFYADSLVGNDIEE